jgi:uncharacterized protein
MHSISKLDHLADLLLDLPYENHGMTLSQFDGFCAGLIVCPDMILPSEWLPKVWGTDVEPFFQDADHAEITIDAATDHYNRVVKVLANNPDNFDPIFGMDQNNDDLLWQPWVAGFEQAMCLRPDTWKQIINSDDDEAASSVGMIIAMNDVNHGQSKLDDAAIDHIDEIATDLIPNMVQFLNAWTKGWLSPAIPLASNTKPKTGDNAVRYD